ncbi:formate dehydrogenase subunit delta [Methylocystis parvus]|uniref:formate dehydrogenase subunit delta n=1 Tax=Methylocystis parvus TaxID=134 RepID=UPI003C75C3C8
MANQIGAFWGAQTVGGPSGMAEHLRKFWEPHMRDAIIEHVKHGGAGLDPVSIEAIKLLETEKAKGAA